jgi:hypothetical protein
MQNRIKALWFFLIGASAVSSPVVAATIVSDPFSDGERTQASATPDAKGIPWYVISPASNSATLVVADDPTLGSGNSLQLANENAGNSIRGIGKFAASPQTLVTNTGDKAILTVDFRLSNNVASTNGLRIGLANSNGSVMTADQNGNSSANGVNDFSYSLAINTGSATAGSNFFTEDGTVPSILGGGDYTQITTAGTQISINDTAKRTLIFTLTKTATGVSLEAVIKNSAGATLTTLTATPTNAFTAFDEIAFGNGTATTAGINIDNVDLTTVPEPAALTTAGLAGLLFLGRRRQRMR